MGLQNPLDTELARRGGVNGLITQIKKLLTSYFLKPTGKSTDYIRGDGSIAPFPTISGSTYNPTAGTGISITGTSPNQTITNTLPDQTVVLNPGTGIGVAGTYPNFTISNTSPSSGGTVTSIDVDAGTGISVSPAGPITTSGTFTVTNTAPDQIVSLSAGSGISVTGTYPSFTITNTSPSGGGTVTSVSALTLGTAGTDLSSTVVNGTTTPTITLNVPTASATNRGALSSTDWNTFNAKQDSLVSGTNIKTINSNSLLGSGDLTISASPSGSNGQIQFNNSGAFGSDANLVWDNTNKRLGIGATPSTSVRLDVRSQGALSTDIAFRIRNSANSIDLFRLNGDGSFIFRNNTNTAFWNFLTAGGMQLFSGSTTASINIGTLSSLSTNGAAVGLVTGNQSILQYNSGNFQLEEASGILQTNGRGCLTIKNAITIPTISTADRVHIYSADIIAGNAAPHFRTENGNIIKLYKETTSIGASAFIQNSGNAVNDASTFDGYTIAQIVKALKTFGFLA